MKVSSVPSILKQISFPSQTLLLLGPDILGGWLYPQLSLTTICKSRCVRPTHRQTPAVSFRQSVILSTNTATSSHLTGVNTKSPFAVSKKKPLGGFTVGLGVHLMEVGGTQNGVIGYK